MFWILYFVAIPLAVLVLIGAPILIVRDIRRYRARGKYLRQELELLRQHGLFDEPRYVQVYRWTKLPPPRSIEEIDAEARATS